MSYIIQKIKTIFSLFRHPYFGIIKLKTKGYLSPTVYFKMYQYAKAVPPGHAIDIGPAQGGSSIAIGKGMLEKATSSEWKLYSIEKGHTSNALSNGQGVDENKSVLQNNLDEFHVGQIAQIIMKYSDEAFVENNVPTPISVLCIDADGALDRDFAIFYNSVVKGGAVILDDYEDMINRHGKKLLTGSESDIQEHIKNHRAVDLAGATPLGKELLTFRLVNYLKTVGLLEEKEIVGSNTWFGIKPEHAPELNDVHMQKMQEIRDEIAAEFWEKREALLAST